MYNYLGPPFLINRKLILPGCGTVAFSGQAEHPTAGQGKSGCQVIAVSGVCGVLGNPPGRGAMEVLLFAGKIK